MTDTEERLYLETLLLESARWRISEDDVYSPIEREIMDRLRRLNGINTEDENGYVQSNLPAESEALEAAKLNEHLASAEKAWQANKKWKADKVRCTENGRIVWHKKCECIQMPRDNSKGGPAWMWKWMGPATTTDEKKAQEEEQMWAEHEQGEEV